MKSLDFIILVLRFCGLDAAHGPQPFTFASSSQRAATMDLAKMTASIRVDKATNLGSVIDVINIVNPEVTNAARDLQRTIYQYPFLSANVTTLRINNKGKPTPVADVHTLLEIIHALPGRKARAFRQQDARLICRVLGGDMTLVKEIEERHSYLQETDVGRATQRFMTGRKRHHDEMEYATEEQKATWISQDKENISLTIRERGITLRERDCVLRNRENALLPDAYVIAEEAQCVLAKSSPDDNSELAELTEDADLNQILAFFAGERLPLKSLRESDVRDALAKELEGQTEVKTVNGFIDVLTELEIIEIKRFREWKHALGQVLAYSKYYPYRQRRVHLFANEAEQSMAERVFVHAQDTCARYDVAVTLEVQSRY